MKRILLTAVFFAGMLALSASEADAQYLYGYHGGLYRGYYSSYGPSLGYYGAFSSSTYSPALGFNYPVYRSTFPGTSSPYYSRAYYYRPPTVAYPGYPGYAYPPYGTYGGFRTPGYSFYYGR